MTIYVLDEAEQDLLNGAGFYDRQELGLGDYFVDSVMADIDSLHLYAGIHPVFFGKHRLLCKTFPYGIYYTRIDDVVRVYAVLDQRRNPAWIRARLDR